MYINIKKILRIPFIIIGVGIIAAGVYGYVWASDTIYKQIAAALISIFGLQLVWFTMWVTKEK